MTEILKCPLLPDVEPQVQRAFVSDYWRVTVWSPGLYLSFDGASSAEKTIEFWNAWMQPLHDLKAERERQAARIAELEAQVAFLQGAVHKNDDTVKWARKPLPRSGDAP
jgi:hypothetical protein